MAINIISLVFSAVALGFSLFVYIKHDKRIKPLELEIAEHHAKKIREQEAAKNIAILNASSRYMRSGKLYIKITNCGQAIASDINVEVLEDGDKFQFCNQGLLPFTKLHSMQSFELEYMTFEQSPKVIKIRITWNDPSSKNKSQEFDLQAD